jgi:hypothetical protein
MDCNTPRPHSSITALYRTVAASKRQSPSLNTPPIADAISMMGQLPLSPHNGPRASLHAARSTNGSVGKCGTAADDRGRTAGQGREQPEMGLRLDRACPTRKRRSAPIFRYCTQGARWKSSRRPAFGRPSRRLHRAGSVLLFGGNTWMRHSARDPPGRTRYVRQDAPTLTTTLPKFRPSSSPLNESGAFSRPSTTCSR